MRLLHSEIERIGGQLQWAKMVGVSRPNVNKMLRGTRRLSKPGVKALMRWDTIQVCLRYGRPAKASFPTVTLHTGDTLYIDLVSPVIDPPRGLGDFFVHLNYPQMSFFGGDVPWGGMA